MTHSTSIIVPAYQHADYLEDRLTSLLRQTCQPLQTIIIDDCSKDASPQIIRQFEPFFSNSTVILRDTNSGNPFIQWKKGIELSLGKYIWVAESDDVASVQFLEKMTEVMEKNEDVNLCFCQSYQINNHGKITGDWSFQAASLSAQKLFEADFIMDGKQFAKQFLIHKNVIPNASAVLIRKTDELLSKITTLQSLRTCGDWLLYFNLCMNSKVAYVAERLNYFRIHGESNVAKVLKGRKKQITNIEITLRQEFGRILKEQPGHADLKEIAETNRKYLSKLRINRFRQIV